MIGKIQSILFSYKALQVLSRSTGFESILGYYNNAVYGVTKALFRICYHKCNRYGFEI